MRKKEVACNVKISQGFAILLRNHQKLFSWLGFSARWNGRVAYRLLGFCVLMPVKLVAEQEIKVGESAVLEGPSPSTPFAAVFEDDGETGYFYALDTTQGENPILDALHIYDVESVSDRHRPSKVRIVWSPDVIAATVFRLPAPMKSGRQEGMSGTIRCCSCLNETSGKPPADLWAKVIQSLRWRAAWRSDRCG
jgi:hypothetical protein